jgi:MFS family permease
MERQEEDVEGEQDDDFVTIARRWWILGVLSLVALEQGWLWNEYGPIAPAIQSIYGWDDGTIATLANWGPIAYCIAVLPTAYALDTMGLRPPVLVAAGLVAAGAACKCITVQRGAEACFFR